MAGVLVLAVREESSATQPLRDEPKMQLSMRAEAAPGMTPCVPDDFGKTLTATQEGEVIFPPFFSGCLMIKSQMSDTARHPKSAHCINISHGWQLCIKTTCS